MGYVLIKRLRDADTCKKGNLPGGFVNFLLTTALSAFWTCAWSGAFLAISLGGLFGRLFAGGAARMTGPLYPVFGAVALLCTASVVVNRTIDRLPKNAAKGREAVARLSAEHLTQKQVQALVATYAERKADAAQRAGRRIAQGAVTGTVVLVAGGIAIGASAVQAILAIGAWLLASALVRVAAKPAAGSAETAIRAARRDPIETRTRIAAMLQKDTTYRSDTEDAETATETADCSRSRTRSRTKPRRTPHTHSPHASPIPRMGFYLSSRELAGRQKRLRLLLHDLPRVFKAAQIELQYMENAGFNRHGLSGIPGYR